MSRVRRAVVAAGAAGVVGLAASAAASPPALPLNPPISPQSTKISHVVIVYEENHSFDDLLGDVCATRVLPCNGFTGPVRLADGSLATNVVEPDLVPRVGHRAGAQALALANRWNEIRGCHRTPHLCVTHATADEVPNLAALARQFVVSDATFADKPEASWGAHIEIASGRTMGFKVGAIPGLSKTGATPQPGWGCHSNKDVRWHTGALVPTCVPDQAGNGPYRASPVPYRRTMMQILEAAGVSWRIYQGVHTAKAEERIWNFCTYYYWCLDRRLDSSYSSMGRFSKAAAGTLPNVSYVLPTWKFSQHNDASLARGDNLIGNVVHAVENGPNWSSTAIFITWDDCGCFYDHVAPPAGAGPRNPMVIVSPWVTAGGVDSTPANQPYSMLAFIQHNFGLPAVSPAVDSAYDYADAFDFSQTPTAAVPMTSTAIPAAERRELHRLAQLPRNLADPS